MNKTEPRKTSLMLSESDLELLNELLGTNTSEKIRNAIRVAYYVQRKAEKTPTKSSSVAIDLDALRAMK